MSLNEMMNCGATLAELLAECGVTPEEFNGEDEDYSSSFLRGARLAVPCQAGPRIIIPQPPEKINIGNVHKDQAQNS